MKKIISFGIGLGALAPFVALAADAASIITRVNQILNLIIPVLITLAVV